jgi:MFS family permease
MATYTTAAVLLALTGYLFQANRLTPTTQTVLWTVVFFFASPAASSAYLTVSEIFPVELRGMVIALFFATGTLIGGTLAPWLFGHLIDSGVPRLLFSGDLFASTLLLVTVLVVRRYGVKAERSALEEIAAPLSAAGGEEDAVSI